MPSLTLVILSSVAGSISLLHGVTLAVVGRGNSRIAGLREWSASAVLNGFGMILLSLRFWFEMPWLTKVLPTALNMLAAALIYAGACAFAKRPTCFRKILPAALPLFAAYLYFLKVDARIDLRAPITSGIFILFLFPASMVLLREAGPRLRAPSKWLGILAGGMGAYFAIRGVAIFFSQMEGDIFQAAAVHFVHFAVVIGWVMAWPFGVLLLVYHHQVVELSESHERHLRDLKQIDGLERQLIEQRAAHERAQLLRDLHDGVGGVSANLVQLAARTQDASSLAESREIASQIELLAIESQKELRLLMNAIERGELYWGQILHELHAYARLICDAHGIALDWRLAGMPPEDPVTDFSAAISFVRTVREALQNLGRHSAARHARIRFRFTARRLSLLLTDDGRGLPGDPAALSGRGLKFMRSRVEELGGRLRLTSAAGLRTLLVVPLPLEKTTSPSRHDPPGPR